MQPPRYVWFWLTSDNDRMTHLRPRIAPFPIDARRERSSGMTLDYVIASFAQKAKFSASADNPAREENASSGLTERRAWGRVTLRYNCACYVTKGDESLRDG